MNIQTQSYGDRLGLLYMPTHLAIILPLSPHADEHWPRHYCGRHFK